MAVGLRMFQGVDSRLSLPTELILALRPPQMQSACQCKHHTCQVHQYIDTETAKIAQLF